MHVPLRHYLATTTVGTLFLILLGVYTGKIGAGLSCEGRWPLCDGWMGLFPATWPSFVEWFHRLVAMVIGFMIIGAAILAFYHNYNRYIRYPLALAVLLLPVQILLGANTVLNFGVWASMAHQTAAQLVFAALLFSTTVAYLGPGRGGGESTTASQSAPAGSQADD
jgi:cytochrome c oxidase assembly protein subunit 15